MLQKTDSEYKIFRYLFYICILIVSSIVSYFIYASLTEYFSKGTYVVGEVLVKTEFPTPHFAKLVTWLYFASLIGWYCATRSYTIKITSFSSWKITLIRLMTMALTISCLYATIYSFMILEVKTSLGIVNGKVPDIDGLTCVYFDAKYPWNLTFAAKIFLTGFLISTHALYLSIRSKKV